MTDALVTRMGLRARLLWQLTLFAVLLVLYGPTFEGMVSIWWRSGTFTHCFFVLPIVGYLVWRKRLALQHIAFRTDPRGLPFLGLTGFAWLLADLIHVQVVAQLAVVVMIVVLVWVVLGWTVVRILAFPLGFLLFAVPMGEAVVYPLMQLTATVTVTLLSLSGIPVFSEGTFISIPSGDWSVVEACSGIRYLIASVFLGSLYAYLSYRSPWRRVAFMALATVVPILANGVRAFLIVMIGHLSGMKLAVGIDHLIYGWVFFGFVMFVLFAIGNLWSEQPTPEGVAGEGEDSAGRSGGDSSELAFRGHLVLAMALLLLAFWPAFGTYADHSRAVSGGVGFEMPAGRAGWQAQTKELTEWTPRYLGPSQKVRRDFQRGADQVGVFLAIYADADHELINSENVMVASSDPLWKMPDQERRDVRMAGEDFAVIEAPVHSPGQRLLVWHWYWINGRSAGNAYEAKVWEVLALLSGQAVREAGLVLYTPMDTKLEPARERLRQFAEAMLPAINTSLDALILGNEPLEHGPSLDSGR